MYLFTSFKLAFDLRPVNSATARTENYISTMWTDTPEARQKRRKALTDLCVVGRPIEEFNTFHHIFKSGQIVPANDKRFLAFTADEYVRVSTRTRSAIAAGYVRSVTRDTIAVTLERNLLRTYPRERFILDSVESNTMMRKNTANLGRLLDDSAPTNRLRALIIDRVPPTFRPGPPIVFDEITESTMNPEQNAAVQLALNANDYMLLRGLPGTGKTKTIATLVLLLFMQKKRVLITSHTHSAVDTLLERIVCTTLAESPDVLRIGDETRISPRVARFSHSAVMAGCSTPDEMRKRYARFVSAHCCRFSCGCSIIQSICTTFPTGYCRRHLSGRQPPDAGAEHLRRVHH